MDNIVNLFGNQKTEAKDDPSLNFAKEHLLPWAEAHGIDTSSRKFKLAGATILTSIQGMLLDDI